MEKTRAPAPPQPIHWIHSSISLVAGESTERDTHESFSVVDSESQSESQGIVRTRAGERNGLGVDSCDYSRDDDGVDDESHNRQGRCEHRSERGEEDKDADRDEGEDESEGGLET